MAKARRPHVGRPRHPGNLVRKMYWLPERQSDWLQHEARRLQLPEVEVLRRVLDRQIDNQTRRETL